MSTDIKPLLHRFGLTNNEQALFEASLLLGPTSVIGLSHYTHIPRLTTHHAIQGMVEKGLFLETHYGKKRLVYANSIDGLEQILKTRQDDLKKLQEELDHTKHLFHYIISGREKFPQTRLYQGIEGINTVLLETAKDKVPTVLMMYDSNAFGELVDQSLFHRSYSMRKKHDTHTKLIMPEGFRDYRHLERKEDYLVSIKTFFGDSIAHGGIAIWGHKVALHCFQEGLVTTTVIENKQISGLLSTLYHALWISAKDYQEQYLIV